MADWVAFYLVYVAKVIPLTHLDEVLEDESEQ